MNEKEEKIQYPSGTEIDLKINVTKEIWFSFIPSPPSL